MLLHWPNPQVPLAETLGALAHVKKLGMARHIGVSNFTVALIEEAVAACPEPLVCDQVEYHPYLDQTKVREACARHGMAVVAYSPVAKGRIKGDATLARIGQAHGKTAAQVCLRWLVQQNVSAIPRTSKIERLSENIDIFDFALSDEEMRADLRGWEAPRAGSPISVSRRNGIEAVRSPSEPITVDIVTPDEVPPDRRSPNRLWSRKRRLRDPFDLSFENRGCSRSVAGRAEGRRTTATEQAAPATKRPAANRPLPRRRQSPAPAYTPPEPGSDPSNTTCCSVCRRIFRAGRRRLRQPRRRKRPTMHPV